MITNYKSAHTHTQTISITFLTSPSQGPTRMVWAAVGGMANLPCNLTSPIRDDPALLVLWYKQGVHKPIYRSVNQW